MDLVGKKLSRYLIQGELGKGAQAVVYRAVLDGTRKEVAIKVLHAELVNDEVFLKRFHREGRLSSSINHPNVLKVHEVSGEGETYHYIVTDLVVGINLNQFLQVNKIYCPEVALIMALPVLKGLSAVHEKGVVHRDIKPENIMVDWVRKKLTITDLGIAQPVDASRYSTLGMLVGSLAFMAPEQILGKKWDHRVDIWAFGTILYLMTTGRFPFEAQSRDQLVEVICGAECTPPAQLNPQISPRVDRVIRRCLAVDPKQRYNSALEVRRDLEIDLRASGIDNPEEELYTYLINPRSNGLMLYKEIAAGLLLSGRQRLARRVSDVGLALWKRVQAYHPDDPAIQQLDPSKPEAFNDVLVHGPSGEFQAGDFDFMKEKAEPVSAFTAPVIGGLIGAGIVIICLILWLVLR